MVGFQTQLRWPEQKRIFATIPGLQQAEFVRLGQVHRNCYINAPRVLAPTLQTRERPTLLFAGQISGVEGYTESAATGLLAGMNAARLATGRTPLTLPKDTMLGALTRYIASADPSNYQPQNAAFGLLPEPPTRSKRKQDRRAARSTKAMASLTAWIEAADLGAVAGQAP
jgi:methylenetetrahydrofolate--tRNA-(uracil-5-)-methyltransferase